MVRWFRAYWAEEDTWFYFEADAGGQVTRQVELCGPLQRPIAAASLAEERAAQAAGRLVEYERVFGMTALTPVQQWEGYEPQELSADAFESVWAVAHATCRMRARIRPQS
ncbi:MAG TPA: hypothetical protein VHF26_01560 [Trebonia sp.]|nr:hypothetical protein [Trebonia sp.]